MQSTTVLASRKQTVIDMFVSEYGKIKTSELLSLLNYANCIKTKLAIVSPKIRMSAQVLDALLNVTFLFSVCKTKNSLPSL